MPPSPTISVIGLGHVGMVQAACLADEGWQVVAFDRDPARREAIANARCPIVEPGLPELIEAAVNDGRLRICRSIDEALGESEISIICVGTSSADGSEIDVDDLLECLDSIAGALSSSERRHAVTIRSTLPVGAMRQQVLPRLAPAGAEITCLYIPEFMREGSALRDYRGPSKIIVGCATDEGRSERLAEQIYHGISAPLHFVSYEMAELSKLADNAWHALKVCFANEMGALSTAFGIDRQRLMEL